MKKSWTFISLLAALAAGGASAQGGTTTTAPGTTTTAGTKIINTAEIVFTPENGTETTTPSNPVETTVLPVPSFTITPNDVDGSDVTKPNYDQTKNTQTVKPCDKNVDFLYTLTNTGNVPKESYTLTNTPDPSGTVKTPENIRFYAKTADTNNDNVLSAEEIAAATPIKTISNVNPGQSVQFFQVYDIPCAANNNDQYGGDPTGTRQDNPDFTNDPSVPVDANNSNKTIVSRNDGTIVGPKDDSNADNKTDGTTTQNPPYVDTTPGDTTPDTIYPGGTTLPGGTNPVPADEQQAIGKCTTGTQTVTFTNTVTNTGNRDDIFKLTVTQPTGTTVTLLDTSGNPITQTPSLKAATYDANGTMTAAGGSYSFLVRVTYDGCLTAPATVNVTATSTNNPSISDTTKDTILTPGLSFGDPTPTPGGDPTPVGTPPTGVPGNPGTPIDQTKCTGTGTLTYVPMEIANLGTAPDLYNVSGTALIKLVSGSTVTTNLTYYKDVNENGKYDAGTDTALTDTNGDGVADTGYIAPNTEVKLIATLLVPCDAASQVITLNQVAKSPVTGVTVTDPNDTVTVGQSPVAQPEKKVDLAEAKPGDTLTYTIIGKNTSNGNITKAMVCDTVPANTSFVSWTATSNATGTILYSNTGGSTWSDTAPTTAGTKLCAAVDTNGDRTITTADVLKPGQSINVTFKVKVN